MDPSKICGTVLIHFFRIFVRCMKKRGEMTHKEAVRKALEMLGGKAHTQQIYPIAIKLIGNNTKSKNIKATIRRELNSSPYAFKRTPGKKGYWELIEYQEEVATLKMENEDLKERNNELMAIPKETEFIEKFLAEVMNDYKRKRPDADPIRNILRHMGHEEAAAVLDAWIDEKKDELAKALLKLAEKPTYNYERGAIHLDKKKSVETDDEDEKNELIE